MAEGEEREIKRFKWTEKAVISDMTLYDLSCHRLGPKWKELALTLGFSDIEIWHFKKDNQDCVANQIHAMLTKWRRNQPPSVNQTKALCTALEKVGRRDLATMLPELVQTSQESGHSSTGTMEDRPSTSQEPIAQPAATQTPGLSACQKLDFRTKCNQIRNEMYRTLVTASRGFVSIFEADHVQTSQESRHPSTGTMENQPSTSQEPTTETAVAQTPAQIAADSCEEAIKKHYSSNCYYVQMIPWVDDDTMHIRDIYTKLELATTDNATYSLNSYQDKGMHLLDSYEKIFSLKTGDGDLIKRAILNGLAGRGKSTLFGKMAYDWAVKACHALRKFKLVILLKMCALEQSSELVDAIFDQLLDEDTSIDRGDLGLFIDKNPEKILILLDGFDEFMTTSLCRSSFGSILKILNRKKCRECFVLVTTRPSHFDKLVTNQLVQKPFTHVTVLGFSHHDVEDYVNKFYRNEHDKANGLLERIQSSQILSNLAESPMLLLLMCLLWREDSTLPETSSRLYNEAVKYMFKRKVEDVTPEEVWQIVTEIGKIGLDGLLQPSQVLSFREKDFEKHVLKMGIKAGILTRQRVLKGLNTHNSIQFTHKTFQEFCAAKYLQSLVEEDMKRFQESLDQMMRFPSAFEYLLRFCCGDSEVCTNIVIQALQERYPVKMGFDEPLGKLALHCYFEGQSEHLPPENFIHSMITDSVHLLSSDRDHCNLSTCFLKRVADQTQSTGNTYLTKVVEFVVLPKCNIELFGASLRPVISSMTNLQTLCFEYPCGSNVKHIVSPMSGETSMFVPELAHIDARGSAPFWFPDLKQMEGLRVLQLSGGLLTVEDLKHIIKCLSDLPNFTTLKFSCCKIACSVVLLVIHLQSLKPLQKLSFFKCSLTGEDMVHIVVSLCHLPDLVALSFAWNDLGGSVALWAIHLQSLKRLQKLDLLKCYLTGEDMVHIVESLCHLPDLMVLIFGYNLLGGSVALWAIHLQGLKHLNKLDLNRCFLTGEGMMHIVESVCHLPNLTELNFSGNDDLGGSVALWAIQLQSLKRLQKLDLYKCSLTGEDMVHIVESLCHLPDLMVLIFGYNHLGGSAAHWAIHLQSLKCLQKLDLRICSLTGEDMLHIVESLCHLPDLMELNFSKNDLGGSAAHWAIHLQSLKCLQKLDLSICSLTGEDMLHIMASLCDLPDLAELCISNYKLISSAALWSGYLKEFKHLQTLQIRNFSLTDKDIELISESLKNGSLLK